MSDEWAPWMAEWETDEIRPRELADSVAVKCDACRDYVRFACEIARTRRVGSKEIEEPPARFRLCSWHARTLLRSDQTSNCVECAND